jgi:hypothetical protein
MASTRTLLRTLTGVELWHAEEKGDQRRPIIRYVVKRGEGERTFERPHEAWQYFQKLTNAPDKDVRPEPPPIDGAQLSIAPRPRKRRRGRPRGGTSL